MGLLRQATLGLNRKLLIKSFLAIKWALIKINLPLPWMIFPWKLWSHWKINMKKTISHSQHKFKANPTISSISLETTFSNLHKHSKKLNPLKNLYRPSTFKTNPHKASNQLKKLKINNSQLKKLVSMISQNFLQMPAKNLQCLNLQKSKPVIPKKMLKQNHKQYKINRMTFFKTFLSTNNNQPKDQCLLVKFQNLKKVNKSWTG